MTGEGVVVAHPQPARFAIADFVGGDHAHVLGDLTMHVRVDVLNPDRRVERRHGVGPVDDGRVVPTPNAVSNGQDNGERFLTSLPPTSFQRVRRQLLHSFQSVGSERIVVIDAGGETRANTDHVQPWRLVRGDRGLRS